MAIPALVSSSFCVPRASKLVVKFKSFFSSSGSYVIKDEEGSILFKMKTEGLFVTPVKRRIYDAASGEVLLLMKQKVPWVDTNSWVAFHGDTESESQVLFTLKRNRSSWCSSVVSLDGFFPKNNDSSSPDFSMEAKSWSSEYSVLYNGTPIAKGKTAGFGMVCSVQIYPEVDRAFIAALSMIWILEYLSEGGATVG